MFQIKTPQWRQRSCVNYSPCPRGGRVHGGAEQQIWHLLVQLTGHNTPSPPPLPPRGLQWSNSNIFLSQLFWKITHNEKQQNNRAGRNTNVAGPWSENHFWDHLLGTAENTEWADCSVCGSTSTQLVIYIPYSMSYEGSEGTIWKSFHDKCIHLTWSSVFVCWTL